MLPRAARLTSGRDFSETVRNGRRSGTRSLVVHLHPGSSDQLDSQPDSPPDGQQARAGLVVSRAVGGSVVRNRVKRRLRHLLAGRLEELPPASRVVVRALPPAAEASSAELDRDLRRAVERALQRPASGRSRP